MVRNNKSWVRAALALLALVVVSGCDWFGDSGGEVGPDSVTLTFNGQEIVDGSTFQLGEVNRTDDLSVGGARWPLVISVGANATALVEVTIDSPLLHPEDPQQVARLFADGTTAPENRFDLVQAGTRTASSRFEVFSQAEFFLNVGPLYEYRPILGGVRTADVTVSVRPTGDGTAFSVSFTMEMMITHSDGLFIVDVIDRDPSADYSYALAGGPGVVTGGSARAPDSILSRGEDLGRLPLGDYFLIVREGNWDPSMPFTGVRVPVKLEGDTFLAVSANDFQPAVAQTVAMFGTGFPDGAGLHALWMGAAPSVTGGIEFLVSASGSFSSGAASTSTTYLLPGDYALGVLVDQNANSSLDRERRFVGIDEGESTSVLTPKTVSVSGGTTIVDVADLSVAASTYELSPHPDRAAAVPLGAPREIPVGSSLTYFDIPERNGLGLGYAVYVTAAPGTIEDFTVGRGIGTFTFQDPFGFTEQLSGNTYQVGISAGGTSDYVAEVDLQAFTSGHRVSVTVEIQEAQMGGTNTGSAIPVAIGTPTWIGSPNISSHGGGFFRFEAAAANHTLAFSRLTLGVDVEVTDSMGGTVVTTSDGTLSQLSKTVPLTGLTPGETYFVEVSSASVLSNDSSIGLLEID